MSERTGFYKFMTKIRFSDTYITVMPSYEQTREHSHSMLHVFFGKGPLKLGDACGRMIVLEQNVMHKCPEGEILFFLFVEPTSRLAEILRRDYLKGRSVFSTMDMPLLIDSAYKAQAGWGIEKIEICLSDLFGDALHTRREGIDHRILSILEKADRFEYLDKRVKDLARELFYSESYLAHLFKEETGTSLKNYLLLRRFEYVWQKISCGEQITTVVMDAGFSSPSHFADTCRKLTGISAAEVMR
ncbi:MAG: helix-turn-helix transcriptional regulator [Clostridiales bacterium]|nr:helix-turn-helix transcriptional regulator [Clostridiales bacterium]